jgi:hypothetical protein
MSIASAPSFVPRAFASLLFACALGLAGAACTSDTGFPAGAPPEGSDVTPGGSSGDSGACTLSQVASLFSTNCTSCHSGATAPDGLDLTSSGLTGKLSGKTSHCGGKLLVSPGDAASSYLLDKLQGSQSCGVQMPKGHEPLDATSINCVADWIDALAPGSGGGGDPGTGGGGTPPGGGGGW